MPHRIVPPLCRSSSCAIHRWHLPVQKRVATVAGQAVTLSQPQLAVRAVSPTPTPSKAARTVGRHAMAVRREPAVRCSRPLRLVVRAGTRIAELVPKVEASRVAAPAVEAREQMKLRHVLLLVVREMVRHKTHRELVGETLSRSVQRADELSEFLPMYPDACLFPSRLREGWRRRSRKAIAHRAKARSARVAPQPSQYEKRGSG